MKNLCYFLILAKEEAQNPFVTVERYIFFAVEKKE